MDIVGNVRIAEDSIAFVMLSIGLVALLRAWVHLEGTKVRYMPMTLFMGLIPLYIWKGLGAVRRIFVSKTEDPALYNTMHDIGEVFESLGGLVIALAIVLIWYRVESARSISKMKARATRMEKV